jgi:hypothetical protein
MPAIQCRCIVYWHSARSRRHAVGRTQCVACGAHLVVITGWSTPHFPVTPRLPCPPAAGVLCPAEVHVSLQGHTPTQEGAGSVLVMHVNPAAAAAAAGPVHAPRVI